MVTQFWMDVIEAYNMVEVHQERTIKVARNGKEATIYLKMIGQVSIDIVAVKTETVEPLIEP